jgi:hypothetical protein
MHRRWLGKNIDLNQLSALAEDFFKDKGYATRRIEAKGEHVIAWTPRRVDGISRSIYSAVKLKISGKPEDFVIDMVASEATRRFMWLGMLTSALGGGYLTLQSSRLRETLEKLENEFWVYIEDKVATMTSQSLR